MKRIAVCMLTLALVLCLSACGGGGKDVDLNALADDLTASAAFTQDMSQYEVDASLAAPTYRYDAADATACRYFYNNGGSGEEILLVQAKDAETAGAMEELCRERVELQKASLANYSPDAIPRLDNAILEISGEYVIFVVANDAAAAQAVVDGYLK